jgi:hypothetical protein
MVDHPLVKEAANPIEIYYENWKMLLVTEAKFRYQEPFRIVELPLGHMRNRPFRFVAECGCITRVTFQVAKVMEDRFR